MSSKLVPFCMLTLRIHEVDELCRMYQVTRSYFKRPHRGERGMGRICDQQSACGGGSLKEPLNCPAGPLSLARFSHGNRALQ